MDGRYRTSPSFRVICEHAVRRSGKKVDRLVRVLDGDAERGKEVLELRVDAEEGVRLASRSHAAGKKLAAKLATLLPAMPPPPYIAQVPRMLRENPHGAVLLVAIRPHAIERDGMDTNETLPEEP